MSQTKTPYTEFWVCLKVDLNFVDGTQDRVIILIHILSAFLCTSVKSDSHRLMVEPLMYWTKNFILYHIIRQVAEWFTVSDSCRLVLNARLFMWH